MKKTNLNSKTAKYIIGVKKGKTKKQAALDAGYSLITATHNVDKIENTLTYKETEKVLSYKDEILKQTTLSEIANEQLKVVFQDDDLGAKNTAIKQIVQSVEPDGAIGEGEEKIIIVMKN